MSERDTSPEEQYRLRGPVGKARTIVIRMPSGWARAALSGIEAALLSWAIPTLLGVYGLLSQGGNPWLEQVDLAQAAGIGTSFWALSLGAPVVIGGLPITLIPLLWTAIQVLLLRLLLRRGKGGTASAQWFAVPAFLVTAELALVFSPAQVGTGGILLGATLVPLLASGWAAASHTEKWPQSFLRLRQVWQGLRIGLLWFAVSFGVGLVALLASAIASWSAANGVAAAIGAEAGSRVLLGLIEFSFVPTFAAWGLAWLAGPGFSLSGGLASSPTSLASGELPSFPASALVPTTTPGNVVVLFVVVAGIAVGAFTGWRLREAPLKTVLVRLGIATGTLLVLIGVWFALSRGALGSDLMARLGPMPAAWPLVLAEFALPALAAALSVHPATLHWGRETALAVGDKAKRVSSAE